jgi:hypothetical protein
MAVRWFGRPDCNSVLVANDGDGHGRPPDDGLGDAAQQDPGDALAAVAPDDDVADIVFLGVVDDAPCGPADDGVGRDVDAGLGGHRLGLLEDRVGPLLGGGHPVVGAAGPPRRRAVDGVHHVERGDRIGRELFEGVFERDVGGVRAVDGNEHLHGRRLQGPTYKAGRPLAGRREGHGMYDAVSSLLDRTARIAAFPDGSLDIYSEVRGADGSHLSKAAFQDRLTGARSRTFHLEERVVEPGGQAVNAAQQAHALGDAVRLDGCLDHHRLDLPFESHSHGKPSRVHIHEFTDGDLLYVSESDDVAGWTADAFDTLPDADGYFGANWATIDGMTDALHTLAGDLDGEAFVFDPGDVTTAASGAVRGLADALGAVDDGIDTALSVNDRELAAFADALGVAADEVAVRREADLSSVVVHEEDAARAAHEGGTAAVRNLEIDHATRNTGGGDRFGAGFLHGLAVGGDIEAALALGNACASYYVETGRTGTADEIVEFVDGRSTL